MYIWNMATMTYEEILSRKEGAAGTTGELRETLHTYIYIYIYIYVYIYIERERDRERERETCIYIYIYIYIMMITLIIIIIIIIAIVVVTIIIYVILYMHILATLGRGRDGRVHKRTSVDLQPSGPKLLRARTRKSI